MKSLANLTEEQFLQCIQEDGMQVTLFTTNGYQQRGTVCAHDENSITVVGQDGVQMLIYKHAVSTIYAGTHKTA